MNNSDTIMQNALVIASATLLLNYYILGRVKRGFGGETWNWKLCTTTIHTDLYLGLFLLLITMKL